jgi:hypothetical protein
MFILSSPIQFSLVFLSLKWIADEDEGDGYQVLRRAVKQYWGTMKEYYQAVGHPL